MTATIDVEGMSCEGCEESVEDALMGVSGVTAANADRENGTATVEGDADAQALVDAVEDAGYKAHT